MTRQSDPVAQLDLKIGVSMLALYVIDTTRGIQSPTEWVSKYLDFR